MVFVHMSIKIVFVHKSKTINILRKIKFVWGYFDKNILCLWKTLWKNRFLPISLKISTFKENVLFLRFLWVNRRYQHFQKKVLVLITFENRFLFMSNINIEENDVILEIILTNSFKYISTFRGDVCFFESIL